MIATLGRQAVAAFVALHLFAVTLCALPSVGSGMNRQAWKQPTVQGEFEAWSRRLGGLGVAIGPDDLEDRAWDFAVGYEAGRERVLAPFQPYFRYCGTWQSWKMFVAPHRFPARLEIELERTPGSGFEPLFVARSDEHDWHRRWFDHDRFRAALFRYEWEHFGKPRQQFATWVARVAADEFPDASRVRVSFVRYRTLSPEQIRAGEQPAEKRELEQVRTLRGYR